MDRLNLPCHRLDELILNCGRETTCVCLCMHVIGLNLLFAVLHGKQLRAVLTKLGPPASFSACTCLSGFLCLLLKGLLDF